MKSIRILAAVFMAVALGAGLTLAQSGYDLFQKGLVKERAEGNLQAAIQIYARIVKEFPNNRELAAKALVEMGDCYEKLGKSGAEKAYQRVLHDYADQSAEANEARARLAALEHGGAQGKEMVAQRIWADPEVDIEGGVAPSGRFLSYVDWDTGDLAVHDLVTGKNRRVTHKGSWSDSGDFAMNSVPSPDGKEIAYAWARSEFFELRVVGTDGSKPRVLYSNPKVGYIEPYSWSPDGKEILASFWEPKRNEGKIVEVSLADGSTHVLKVFKPPSGEGTGAMFSPDGRFVAYDIPPNESSPARDIYLVSKNGGNATPLIQHPSDDYLLLGWAPDGKSIIFASNRTGSYGVWDINVADGKPSGTPRLLKADIGRVSPMGLTKDGSLYYGIENWIRDEYVASFDFASGKLLKAPAPVSQEFTGRNTGGAWSPDGKFLAYFSRHHLLNGVAPFIPDTIVIRSPETGRERDLVPKLGIAPIFGISWSADGRSIYVTGGNGKGLGGIFRIDAQTGAASILFKSTPLLGFAHAEELPQGNIFVVHRHELGKKAEQLVVHNLKSGQEQVLFQVAQPANVSGFAVSPDGRQVAVTTGGKLRVVPVSGGDARVLFHLKSPEGLAGMGSLAWTPDGKYIVFGKGSTLFTQRQVEFYEISAQGGQPRDLGLSMPTIRRMHIHPDGHRLLFESDVHSAEVWVIHNILPTLKAPR